MEKSQSNGSDLTKPVLTFVSEGCADAEGQIAKEQEAQEQFEADKKRKERKSLRFQLRQNAISKQKKLKSQSRDREGFNRLSKSEVKFFSEIKNQKVQKEAQIKEYLDTNSVGYDGRKKLLLNTESSNHQDGLLAGNDRRIKKKIGKKLNLGIVKKSSS